MFSQTKICKDQFLVYKFRIAPINLLRFDFRGAPTLLACTPNPEFG